MRIDSFQKVSNVYQTNSTTKLAESKKTSNTDKLELSQTGKDYQIAKAALQRTPDVRMDKVNDIKSRMEAGVYSVDEDDLVDKIVEDYYDEII